MRARSPKSDILLSLAHLQSAPCWSRIAELGESFAEATSETAEAILVSASDFAEELLVPLNVVMDCAGAKLIEGRVRTAEGHKEAWQHFVSAGWPGIEGSLEFGGQQLPLALALAAQECFDRACPAFGMLPVPQRSAARLIDAFGDDQVRARYLPGLTTGRLGATICVSEAGAGSDVMQIRTRAVPMEGGAWALNGEKSWISFGDHDLTDEIIHCVLARTDDGTSEVPEISLFVVEGGAAQPDRVSVRGLEKKMGLHGSPTCVLGFEGAEASMLGQRGRGLAQMFVMITQMRLAVGVMGLAISSACTDLALSYAEERRQGGKPGAAVPIVHHADVQRLLFEASASTEMLRGLLFATANLADIASRSSDEKEKEEASRLTQWLLPIVKTAGAQLSFENASTAVQVLGGAGYTSDWPIEQALRDSRVLAVFEGTTGIQALDLVYRRIVRDRSGLDIFLRTARATATDHRGLRECLDLLEDCANQFSSGSRSGRDVEAGATACLELAIAAALGWVAAHNLSIAGDSPARQRISASASYWLHRLGPRARLKHAEALAGNEPLTLFEAIRRR